MKRFKLEKSQDLPDWWVLTDVENLVVCKFKEHEFNQTQQFSILDEEALIRKINTNNVSISKGVSKIAAEMGDYMFSHWYSLVFPEPTFELRQNEESDRTLLIRHKFPKFTIEIQDDCDLKQLSRALNASSEFISKYHQMYGRHEE